MDERPAKPPIHVSAFLCESVIKESARAEGMSPLLTAVRIADAMTVYPYTQTLAAPNGAQTTIVIHPNIIFHMLIYLRGEPREFSVRIRGIKPSGGASNLATFACSTGGPEESAQSAISIKMAMPGSEKGVFWFEIYVDDELSLKLPMIIRHATPVASLEVAPPSPQTQG